MLFNMAARVWADDARLDLCKHGLPSVDHWFVGDFGDQIHLERDLISSVVYDGLSLSEAARVSRLSVSGVRLRIKRMVEVKLEKCKGDNR